MIGLVVFKPTLFGEPNLVSMRREVENMVLNCQLPSWLDLPFSFLSWR
jgi:hypothetical protein